MALNASTDLLLSSSTSAGLSTFFAAQSLSLTRLKNTCVSLYNIELPLQTLQEKGNHCKAIHRLPATYRRLYR